MTRAAMATTAAAHAFATDVRRDELSSQSTMTVGVLP
jgi:hypothetical protein